jgi:protein-S-isoprenylcysteine O-methyltransferase Ste14
MIFASKRETILIIILTILCIVCFPANPLVFTGVLEVASYTALFIIGVVVWVFGMVLVMAPFIQFPRRGGVTRGKSYVHTTKLVDTGIYAVVRHPQYTGGVYAIFVTTLLWFPHWLFAVLGVLGATLTYLSCKEEDKKLIRQFGDEYKDYMQRVPRMNIFLGIFRLMQRKKG